MSRVSLIALTIAITLGLISPALAHETATDDSTATITATSEDSSSTDTLTAKQSRAWRTCRVNQAGKRWNRKDVKRVIRCAVDRYPVQGGVRKAMQIARRESGFGAHAYNRTGCGGAGCIGVYQHDARYWPTRQNNFDHRHRHRKDVHEIAESGFNARSNVLVSIKMAHSGGWGPWGG